MTLQGLSRRAMLELRPMVPAGTVHVALLATLGGDDEVTREQVLAAYAGLTPSLL